MNPHRWGWVALVLALSACAGGLSNGVFHKGDVAYRVGKLPPSWTQVRFSGNDLAFTSEDSPHTLAVNSTCEGHEDAPLDVLTQHLLMGFTERAQVEQALERLDGRESLRSRYRAKLDGVPVELMLVVLKKDGCVYDFTFLSPPGRLEEKRQVFEGLLNEFHAEPRT